MLVFLCFLQNIWEGFQSKEECQEQCGNVCVHLKTRLSQCGCFYYFVLSLGSPTRLPHKCSFTALVSNLLELKHLEYERKEPSYNK